MKTIAIYPGRFQPFHRGHMSAYNKLVEKFGKENVYIATADPRETSERNPFTFAEKKAIINSMFKIPSENIVKVKSPYKPTEILQKFDPNETIFVTAVGEKDGDRLRQGRYFRAYGDEDDDIPYSKGGYFVTIPNFKVEGDIMSSTKIREKLGSPAVSTAEKVDFFKDVYGQYHRKLFDMMTSNISAEYGHDVETEFLGEPKSDPNDEPEDVIDKTDADSDDVVTQPKPDDDTLSKTNKNKSDLLMKKVRNPQTRRDILVKTALNYDKNHPAYKAAKALFKKGGKFGSTGPASEIFESVLVENALINQFNSLIDQYMTSAQGKEDLRINMSDDPKDIEGKVKQAYQMGIFYYPLIYAIKTATDDDFDYDVEYEPHSNNRKLGGPEPKKTKPVPVPDPGETFPYGGDGEKGQGSQGTMESEEKSSTERVRKYYRNNRDKVRKHLKQTQDDRVARNRDRRKAEKRHGKSYMKDKDVHHPNGPHGGKTRVVKKDHGPDKKKKNEDSGNIDPKVNLIKQIRMGMGIEKEHVGNQKTALKIVLNNLQKDPNYYTKLNVDEPPKNETVRSLKEGGAAGHMMHPYEDMDLTFAEYKDMVQKGLLGSFGEEPVTEKLDGQNIGFSVINGEVRFARNKGHVKNGGAESLSVKGMMDKFSDRGAITRAFVGAAKDLEKTIEHIPDEKLNQIFQNGTRWMNTEIILPDSQNVIPYGKTVLVFHGATEYDDAGNAVDTSRELADDFNDYVHEYARAKQEIFGMQGPQIISFDDSDAGEYEKKAKQYMDDIDRLRDEFNLQDNDKVAQYYVHWWDREIGKELDKVGINASPEAKKALIKRFAFGDKSKRLSQFKNPKLRAWASHYQKNQLKKTQKVAQNPFEMLFLRVGAESLKRVEGLMAANNPGALDKIKGEIDKALKSVSAEETTQQAEKLRAEFERLEQVGLDNMVPSEGMVFIYKGRPYKFTGTFAPINQLLGTFKFGGPAEPEQQPDPAPSAPAEPESDKQFIKQFYGEKIQNPLTGKEITVQSALTYDKSHPAYKAAQQFLQQKIGNG